MSFGFLARSSDAFHRRSPLLRSCDTHLIRDDENLEMRGTRSIEAMRGTPTGAYADTGSALAHNQPTCQPGSAARLQALRAPKSSVSALSRLPTDRGSHGPTVGSWRAFLAHQGANGGRASTARARSPGRWEGATRRFPAANRTIRLGLRPARQVGGPDRGHTRGSTRDGSDSRARPARTLTSHRAPLKGARPAG